MAGLENSFRFNQSLTKFFMFKDEELKGHLWKAEGPQGSPETRMYTWLTLQVWMGHICANINSHLGLFSLQCERSHNVPVPLKPQNKTCTDDKIKDEEMFVDLYRLHGANDDHSFCDASSQATEESSLAVQLPTLISHLVAEELKHPKPVQVRENVREINRNLKVSLRRCQTKIIYNLRN